jgi:ribosomal subunit interface protein
MTSPPSSTERKAGGSVVDIVVTGRHIEVPARLRSYAEEKLAKVDKLCPKAIRIDVEISRERNPRMSEICDRVELTCVSRGPVIRAEAAADDVVVAFDLAWAKLEARLRRAADRRRVHRGSRTPVSVAVATAALGAPQPAEAAAVNNNHGTPSSLASLAGADSVGSIDHGESGESAAAASAETAGSARYSAEGPMLVREKLHAASPMTLDQALYEMELVGHDFYLFCDKETGLPSVVYRRRGYDYGVIRIDPSAGMEGAATASNRALLDGSLGRGSSEALRRTPEFGEIGR